MFFSSDSKYRLLRESRHNDFKISCFNDFLIHLLRRQSKNWNHYGHSCKKHLWWINFLLKVRKSTRWTFENSTIIVSIVRYTKIYPIKLSLVTAITAGVELNTDLEKCKYCDIDLLIKINQCFNDQTALNL